MSSTISLPVGLLGEQKPRVSNAPLSVSSAGPEAIELAASAGLLLDPWQQHAVCVALGERADTKWAAFEVGILVARQNGKGAILEALELAGLYLLGERLILHSSHEFKTTQEAFLRVKALIDGTDDLRKRVRTIRTSHGDEGIELLDGRRLRFVARSRSSGRGFTGDRIILDEAQELPRSAMGAMLPTLSARPNPQVIYTGTVPAAVNDSEHFESVRDRGRAGTDRGLAWMEWTPPDGVVDLDDREAWRVSNPALGYRITDETIERERNALGDDEFARERLSIWSGAVSDTVVNMERWADLTDPIVDESARPSPVAFSVEVSPDRRWSSIGMAGVRPDGARHLQIVQSGKGTAWLPERLAELQGTYKPVAIGIDPAGPAGSLIADLTEADVRFEAVTGREMGQACGMFVDSVADGTVRHDGQTLVAVALGAARKRSTGDAWVWRRRDPKTDISPLVAVTLALFVLARKTKKRRRSPTRVTVMR